MMLSLLSPQLATAAAAGCETNPSAAHGPNCTNEFATPREQTQAPSLATQFRIRIGSMHMQIRPHTCEPGTVL